MFVKEKNTLSFYTVNHSQVLNFHETLRMKHSANSTLAIKLLKKSEEEQSFVANLKLREIMVIRKS